MVLVLPSWYELDTEPENWGIYNTQKSENSSHFISGFKKLANLKGSVEVKGAYTNGNGYWKVIEDLPEDVLFTKLDEVAYIKYGS
jgi:hypothetical protein